MKREIKFRTWSNNNKTMDYDTGHRVDKDLYELMQFTGVQDKDVNEIYEGDILDGNWQIHFYRGMFVAVRCGLTPNMDNSYQIFWVVENGHCVIGNIYENAE